MKGREVTMKWISLMVATALVSGCATMDLPRPSGAGKSDHEGHRGRHAALEDDEPIPTDAATVARSRNVKVLQEESINCPTEALGPVDVHKKMETTEKALDTLKLRAAALGADAVLHTEFEHGEGAGAPTHLSGMAVRCNDLLKGRRYEVIGTVRVDGAMGKEENAFEDLRDKAWAMHADLLMDISFEHGEGGEGETTKLTGKAIRFVRR
jgi:uncharacterized protein YbjQ (UPF0145 family)